MSWKEELLKSVHDIGAFQEGDFVFSSGLRNRFYFDGRLISMHYRTAYFVARWVLSSALSLGANAVGGPTIGADPMVGQIALLAGQRDYKVNGFMVRSEQKGHGTEKRIEGPLASGESVLMYDDTITTGGSIFYAIEAVEAHGCRVVGVRTIADWQMGGSQELRDRGYNFDTIFLLNNESGISIA